MTLMGYKICNFFKVGWGLDQGLKTKILKKSDKRGPPLSEKVDNNRAKEQRIPINYMVFSDKYISKYIIDGFCFDLFL